MLIIYQTLKVGFLVVMMKHILPPVVDDGGNPGIL